MIRQSGSAVPTYSRSRGPDGRLDLLIEEDHFWLSGHDNGSFYYDGTEVDACPECGLVNDLEWANPTFRVKRRQLDLSYTYDGAAVASSRLADVIRSWPGVRLATLPADSGFYLVVIDQVVPSDPERSGTRMLDLCPTCGRFRQIAAGCLACLRSGTVVPDGLSRTDAVFGSTPMAYERYRKTAQSPVLVTTEARVEELARGGFSGLVAKAATCWGEAGPIEGTM